MRCMAAGRDKACRAVQVAWVPGSYELPVVASAMARSGRFDAVVCIGTVVCARAPVLFCSGCPLIVSEAMRGCGDQWWN